VAHPKTNATESVLKDILISLSNLRGTASTICNEIMMTPLREERRLRVFENRVLRRIFGPKRDEVKGDGRKLHNEELNDLYCSPNIVQVIK